MSCLEFMSRTTATVILGVVFVVVTAPSALSGELILAPSRSSFILKAPPSDLHGAAPLRLFDGASDVRPVPTGNSQLTTGHAEPPVHLRGGYRLAGEFEPQRAVMIGCRELIDYAPRVFVEIVASLRGRVGIVALVNDPDEERLAREVLWTHQIDAPHVHYLHLPHDTMWARDYGPLVVVNNRGEPSIVDASYGGNDRPEDDRVPIAFGDALNLPVLSMPIFIDGGNILSNGRGLCIATTALLDSNPRGERSLRMMFRALFGATQVVFLEPLAHEPTGHVDMLASFTSPETVVVGAYDPRIDPINAAVLDRNAKMLSLVRTSSGRLRVVRVPMPPNTDGIWRTHVNVIYANGAVLVPVYPGVDNTGGDAAQDVFSRLLPGWRIIGVDSSVISRFGGALHCIEMNLGPIKGEVLTLRNGRNTNPPRGPLSVPASFSAGGPRRIETSWLRGAVGL